MMNTQQPDSSRIRGKKRLFDQIAGKVTRAAGSPAASIMAVVIVVVWAITGPFFGYSETWQLVINTGTTIITFLMVFVIQQSQNKDTAAVHMKLNELIASSSKASNRLVDLEDLTESEIAAVKKYYRKLAELACLEQDIHRSHSLDEAKLNHQKKKR